jgi:hypothetical protein
MFVVPASADDFPDCMMSGEVPNTNVQFRQYRDHARFDHLNPNY